MCGKGAGRPTPKLESIWGGKSVHNVGRAESVESLGSGNERRCEEFRKKYWFNWRPQDYSKRQMVCPTQRETGPGVKRNKRTLGEGNQSKTM